MTSQDSETGQVVTQLAGSVPKPPAFSTSVTTRTSSSGRRVWGFVVAVVVVAVLATIIVVTSRRGMQQVVTRPIPRSAAASSAKAASSESSVLVRRPEALVVASDGSLLIADQGTNQVLRLNPHGQLSVFAGTGVRGFGGDGGPATRAELNRPEGMAVGPDGTIYVADSANNRVRAISPAGQIATVAGNGATESSTLAGQATTVPVAQPAAVAVHDGRLYIVDEAGVEVVLDRMITPVLPSGPARVLLGGTPTAFYPDAIALDPAGHLYVAESSTKQLIEFSPAGHVLASWELNVTPGGLASATGGSIFVSDDNFAIDRLANGNLATVIRFKSQSIPDLPGTFRPSGVAVANNGTVYAATDAANGGTDEPALIILTNDGHAQLLHIVRRQ